MADSATLTSDEAISTFPTRAEAPIRKALLRLMQVRTSFVMAYGLSTIREATQILVIETA